MDHIINELKRLTDLQDRNKERIKGALALLEAIEWTDKRVKTEPPPPAPTPDAPDPGPGPGPGWRLKKRGEMITEGDQISLGCFGSDPWGPCGLREEVYNTQIRTPIYHNPANLETAGEGYRFCLVSETRQDATDCAGKSGQWYTLFNPILPEFIGGLTYRTKKPLPTT